MSVAARLVVEIAGDNRGAQRAFNETNRTMTSSAERWSEVGRGMERTGQSMTRKLSLPLIGAGVAVTKLGMDFESEMSKIVGLVGISADQVDEWGRDILEMAPQLGKAPKELAEALYFVTSAGIDGAEAMDVLELSAKASAAGLGETKVVADLVSSAINAYGSENITAAEATDILVASVREGKAEASELASSMGRVLPIAAEMGVSFNEVGAAMAAMTRTGTDASTSATQLRAIMVGLLKPSQQAEEALTAMGTSSANLRKTIKEDGLLTAMMDIREMTNKFGEDSMALVFPNIRALAGILDIMGANAADNAAIFDSLNNSAGALDHAFATVADTARFKFDQALSGLKSTAIEMSESLMPAVTVALEDLAEGIRKAGEWWGDLTDSQQQAILKFGAFLVIAGPLLSITGKLVWSVGQLALAYKALAGSAAIANTALLKVAGVETAALKFMYATGAVKAFAAGLAGLTVGTAVYAAAQAHATQKADDAARAAGTLARGHLTAAEQAALLTERTGAVTSAHNDSTGALDSATHATRNNIDAMGDAGGMTQEMIDVLDEYSRANYEARDSLDKLNAIIDEYASVQEEAELADIRVRRSKERVIERQDELATALDKYKKDSPEVIAATDNLTEAEINHEKAVRNAEKARREANDFVPDYNAEIERVAAITGIYTALGREATTAANKRKAAAFPVQHSGGRVTQNARGAIYDRATLGIFGEDGPEMILPLSAKYRPEALGLMEQAAGMLGIGGGGGVNITGPISVSVPDGKVQTFVNQLTNDPSVRSKVGRADGRRRLGQGAFA